MTTRTLAVTLMVSTLGMVPATTITQGRVFVPIGHGPFYVQSHTGKCLTYGTWDPPSYPGVPPATLNAVLYMDDCNQVGGFPDPGAELLQRIRVREVNARRDIVLDAGGKVIGVTANDLTAGMPLELQDYTGAAGQIWAFDGDSLMLQADRSLVAEVHQGRTPRGTRVVLGSRDLDEPELWRFIAVDGTDKKPTTAFVRVPQDKDLRTALSQATWGTVVEIDQSAWIPLDDCSHPAACPDGQVHPDFPLRVPAGVTLRGDRSGMKWGPMLTVSTYPWNSYWIFEVTGNHARITGLRLRGPSTGTEFVRQLSGVFIDDDVVRRPIIDRNDMHGWPEGAVHIKEWNAHDPADVNCPEQQAPRPRTIHVFRNFLHHNAAKGYGYGVTIHANAFATILGNTFLYNRHAIAADGVSGTGYSAYSNLVLSDAPEYGTLGNVEHDFDMHGAEEDDDSHHYGGIAGSDVDIARNTFLGTDPNVFNTRYNYVVRGVPCDVHRFRNNVSRQSLWDGVWWYGRRITGPAEPPSWLEISNNRFSSRDPTGQLAVGDFDGDGVRDLFLATGAAWYYSSGAITEWRFRNDVTRPIERLLFGDIDGDGRTDVLTKVARDWRVSWAGGSKLETINSSDGDMTDFALADFDGDRKADLFYDTGIGWLVSFGCVEPFVPFSSLVPGRRLRELRFGDFNGNGRTDIFWVSGGSWMVWSDRGSVWAVLRPALTSSVDNLAVADFNGDGRSDIALSDSSTWKVSYGGADNWTMLRSSGFSLKNAVAIAPFDNQPGADVLAWEGPPWLGGDPRHIRIFSGGWVDSTRYSRWHLR
jgi:hypothetical protein